MTLEGEHFSVSQGLPVASFPFTPCEASTFIHSFIGGLARFGLYDPRWSARRQLDLCL